MTPPNESGKEEILRIIAAAKPFPPLSAEPHAPPKPKRSRKKAPPPQSEAEADTESIEHATEPSAGSGKASRPKGFEVVLRVVASWEFFRDPRGGPYAKVFWDSRWETVALGSVRFAYLLHLAFYRETGQALGADVFNVARSLLSARAVLEGDERTVYCRVAAPSRDALFYDLGRPDRSYVRFSPGHWQVCYDRCPVEFERADGMRPQVIPERGGMIEQLYQHLNTDEAGHRHVVGWSLGALRGVPPIPILKISGSHGTAKSSLTRMLCSLIDPREPEMTSLTRDVRDLVASVANRYVVGINNTSRLSQEASDTLCRLASGEGVLSRQLHTNSGEVVTSGPRALILNGIAVDGAADAESRMIAIELQRIPDEARVTETEFWKRFNADKPEILGALFDAVAMGLQRQDEVRIPAPPRLADYVTWVEACAPALGWQEGQYLALYAENREQAARVTLEADAVAVAIKNLIFGDPDADNDAWRRGCDRWTGSATKLLEDLSQRIRAGGDAKLRENFLKSREWPANAAALGKRIARCRPLLYDAGIDVEKTHSGVTTWVISRRAQ